MRYDPEGDQEFQLDKLLNKGLTFQDNLDGALLEVVIVSGENTIQHGLGYIPSGYIIIYSENEATFSGSSLSSWTTEQLFLTSSAASPRVRLFVL